MGGWRPAAERARSCRFSDVSGAGGSRATPLGDANVSKFPTPSVRPAVRQERGGAPALSAPEKGRRYWKRWMRRSQSADAVGGVQLVR